MSIHDLATVNACLNAVATACLCAGWIFIRRGDVRRHRRAMLTAYAASATFLASYVVYHFNVGSIPFRGQGLLRAAYYAVLVPHVILAIVVVPLATVTAVRGLGSRFDRHRSIARVTLPVWLYVSVTGVIVYLMLYHF